ncbi:MAG: sterol desaturase family protein [Elusimicrobiota bacterium]
MSMDIERMLFTACGAALLYTAFLLYEHFRPLRRPTQPKMPRLFRNLSMGALGSAVMRLGFYSSLLALAARVSDEGWGLLNLFPLPEAARVVLGFLALDYTLYLWHWANHKVPFLWRFHGAHHADLDMDVSTAARFHFIELALSTAPRAAEILIFGLWPAAVLAYDAAALAAVHFHHSNMRLPARLESALSLAVVTPRRHGIHHSIVRRETDSNFSTVLSVWDRLHRSLRLGIPQEDVVIGIPSHRDPRELTLLGSLLFPFRPPRPWRLPDGTVPDRS